MDPRPTQNGATAPRYTVAKAIREAAIVMVATGAVSVLIGLIPRFQ